MPWSIPGVTTPIVQTATFTVNGNEFIPTHPGPLLLLITEEYKAKETWKLLHSIPSQLNSSSQRITEAEAQRCTLELSRVVQGTQITQTIIVTQQEASRAIQEAGLYKAQLDKVQ